MAGYLRKKRQLKAEINVVPYIDVMLVLLIIFMVTSPFITQGVEVELPKTEKTKPISDIASDPEASFIIVEINQKGQLGLSVNDEDMIRGLNIGQVITRVKAERSINPDSFIAVGGDANTSYANIVLVLDQLSKAGIEKIGLLTDIKENS